MTVKDLPINILKMANGIFELDNVWYLVHDNKVVRLYDSQVRKLGLKKNRKRGMEK